ncbi:MAG: alpha/beta hydrolase [Gemmatimonadaceae bacterium]|nr:alpha/beta hydrolase [Gemmatimonadaceae bacterium]NUQ92479.1 alpha/beta hydrolase [Gemmatimonadaceae bacterium]NUR19978.1 alpha/beta hydrolase [Gemmatimonadaceae bacterium]NUS99139.1 alpha/beta hydrolase [Gemmatimonadaceae bacterium]
MDLQQHFDKSHDGSPQQIAALAEKFDGRRPDPEMAAVLRVMISSDPRPFYELPPKLARKHPTPADAVKALLRERGESTDPEEVGDVDDRKIDGPGGDIEIRVYKPASAASDQLLPVALYIHGGGWVIATIDTYDSSARAICNKAHCIVVSTHYRQAPENKFPAAHEDTFAAYRWVIANARELGGDPSRVAIVGESAGGNMAAVVCLNARDAGIQFPLHQVLVYPIAGYDTNTESYREMAEAQPLDKPAMEWFFEQYLRTPADGATPAISLDRTDLSGLPPATIINAELDPLRSEGELLERRLRESGVDVQRRVFDGVTHEFFGMTPVLAKAREAQQLAAESLRGAFTSRSAPAGSPARSPSGG